jgi:mannose-1-phosphate guanylyltransferase/phosphomannomutase
MKAVIMAGGFGTRLRPLTANMPKPMVPIIGQPVMEHIVRLLKKHHFTEITAILYFQAEQIKNYFGAGKKWGVKINYITPDDDYGTAGAVKSAAEFLNERFIVISGDVLTDFDLKKAIDFHDSKKADSTIVLTHVENPVDFGIVITSKTGKITRFLEKPTWGEVFSDTVNTGIYILEPDILKMIPNKKDFDFSNNLFPEILKRKMKLYGHIAEGYWRDIGNVEEYFLAHQDILDGQVKIKIPGKKQRLNGGVVYSGENCKISPEAQFSGISVLGDNVKIDHKAKIFQSVIGAKSVIGRDVELSRIVGWQKTAINRKAKVSESILCNNSRVGEKATVEEDSILSDSSKVGDNAWIKRNVKIWPNKEVESGATLSTSLVWGERWGRELFSDAKVTGVGNAEITPEFATKLGASYGAIVGAGRTVAVSRGASDASRMIYRAITCGLLSTGVNVADLRGAPIPVIRQELKSGKMAGGINVRLSPEGNEEMDIIFFDQNGRDLPSSKTKSIERLFFREDFRRATITETGSIEYPQRVYESYRESFLKSINRDAFEDAKLKVVIDYGFGGASEILPGILGSLGVDSVSLNSYIDPRQAYYFVGKQNHALDQLTSIVKSLNADIGFLLNSGAEKMRGVDEKGREISLQKALLKVTQMYCHTVKPEKLAVPVTASAGIEIIAKKYGAKVIWMPSDHQAMMEASARNNSIFVGGTKGGFIFPGFQLGVDAMFAVVKILEMLVACGRKPSSITGEWDKLKMSRKEVPCAWGLKGRVMRSLMEYTDGEKRVLLDGVKIIGKNEWIVIRPDRRRAQFLIQSESLSKARSSELTKKYSKLVKSWQK